MLYRDGQYRRGPAHRDGVARQEPLRHSRREIVRGGIKLAFVAPTLSTFLAERAYAANYSCYGQGHPCVNGGPDAEPCCPGLTCQDPDTDGNFTCEP
jgi:hypothetical protein